MKRRFSRKQKEALYWLAEGKCQSCGTPLPENWHADHLHPYIWGGVTDVVNGQALCPTCNLRKGSYLMLRSWPHYLSLRPWQQEFLDKYNALELQNFLLVATPGAGKTIASLRLIHSLLDSGVVERVVTVCPTDHLRTQWLEDATKVNIHLDKFQLSPWTKQISLTDEYVGMVLTYAHVANNQELLRAFTGRYRTMIIFDEIHHCGEDEHLSWGPAILRAFEPATRRLLLSGTPFRSDNNPIPFVTYETDMTNPKVRSAKADHSYGYGHALRDQNVVRHVVFPSYDGRLIWQNFGEKKEVTFKHRLNRMDSGHRLRTALHPEGDWIRKVIKAANEKLDFIRNEEGHSNAGGLIVAADQEHAREYARLLKEITGEDCTLAISDTEDASKEISAFRTSTRKWIVAVKMVAEGVDIKRLRVGIYATIILTPTFFRQVIGRAIRWDTDSRWQKLEDQIAWFYLPNDERLLELAEQIRTEITDSIRDEENKDFRSREGTDLSSRPGLLQLSFDSYEFEHSDGEESHHIFSGERFTLEEMREAETRLAFPGFERVPSASKAYAWRRLKTSPYSSEVVDQAPPQPIYAQKESLKSLVSKKVKRLVRICEQQGIKIPGKNSYATIHGAWGQLSGYSHQSTNDDLESKLTWLEGLISKALQGDHTITRNWR